MTSEQFDNEKKYLVTMHLAKKLHQDGVVSDEDYRQIDTKFKEKYAITFSTLFTTIDLISTDKRVIYNTDKGGSYGKSA